MWLGIDDTDSVRGGCTTHVLTELAASARDRGIDLIGLPRLVRLNPNIPWKTRGNAALSARFGHGTGERHAIGEVAGRPILSYDAGRELSSAEAEAWGGAAWEVVTRLSRTEDSGTDPALILTRRAPPAAFYWRAVREVVAVDVARDWLDAASATYRTLGSPRGLVGALASVAWPSRRRTFELLSYRAPSEGNAPRQVDLASVLRAQQRWPSLFLCYDWTTRRLLVTPHTPCPILFGLRARSATALLRARSSIQSEAVDRWLLFATNQGTGDHLCKRPAGSLPPFSSSIVVGTVTGAPTVRPGGHVAFSLQDRDGRRLECLAFEPTKTLPKVVRALAEGDRVRVWGSRKEDPGFRLEGVEVLRWGRAEGPRRGPRCPACDRPTGSLGRDRGYRCPGCGRRWPPEAGRRSPRRPPFRRDVFHPTPSARRHLAPLGPEGPLELAVDAA